MFSGDTLIEFAVKEDWMLPEDLWATVLEYGLPKKFEVAVQVTPNARHGAVYACRAEILRQLVNAGCPVTVDESKYGAILVFKPL